MLTNKELETVEAVKASMPHIRLFVDAWYQSLQASMKAVEGFAASINALVQHDTMEIARWEGEGGAM